MLYVFGVYTLDPDRYALYRAGEAIALQPQVFKVLTYLVQHRDRVLSKQELFAHLWPEQFVTDEALERCIRLARQACSDGPGTAPVIRTLHGRGYRFVAPVTECQAGALAVAQSAPLGAADRAQHPAARESPEAVGAVPIGVVPGRLPAPGRCAGCGGDHLARVRFCTTCGQPLQASCPRCGFDNPYGAYYCGACAMPLTTLLPLLSRVQTVTQSAPPPVQATSGGLRSIGQLSPEAEWHQLTVMCCDLVWSTALSGQLDPADFHKVLRASLETCVEVIERFGGTIAKFLGGEALVCFGYPQAHADDLQRAVRAGLGIVAAMAQLNTCLAPGWGVQLTVRLGMHTGFVVTRDLRLGAARACQKIADETPNLAARLRELAAPNTVLLSAATARLVDGSFPLESLGPHSLRGVARPVSVYRVLGENAAQTRLDVVTTPGLTPLPCSRSAAYPPDGTVRVTYGQA